MAALGSSTENEPVRPLPKRHTPNPPLMPALVLMKSGLSFMGRCLSVGIGMAAVLCFAGAIGGIFYGTFFASLLSGALYQPMVAWVASKLPTLLTPLAPFFPLFPLSLAFAQYSYQRLVSTRLGGNREAHQGLGGFSVPWVGLLGLASVLVPGGLFISGLTQGVSLGASLYSLAITAGAFGVALGLGREYTQYNAQQKAKKVAEKREQEAYLAQQRELAAGQSERLSNKTKNVADDALDASHPTLTFAQQMQARDERKARQEEVEEQTNDIGHDIGSPSSPKITQ